MLAVVALRDLPPRVCGYGLVLYRFALGVCGCSRSLHHYQLKALGCPMEFDFIHQRPQHFHTPGFDEIALRADNAFGPQAHRQGVLGSLKNQVNLARVTSEGFLDIDAGLHQSHTHLAFGLLAEVNPFCNLSWKRSAIAIIWVLVFCDMDVITAVPRLPHPIIPTLMAELIRDLKTISGFRIVNAETVAAFLRKVLLCIAEIL